MIEFKDITLADKELIQSFTLNSQRRNCDLSFANLCSWTFLYQTKYAVLDGYLLLRFYAGEELAYMMPVGTGDVKPVLEALIWPLAWLLERRGLKCLRQSAFISSGNLING